MGPLVQLKCFVLHKIVLQTFQTKDIQKIMSVYFLSEKYGVHCIVQTCGVQTQGHFLRTIIIDPVVPFIFPKL